MEDEEEQLNYNYHFEYVVDGLVLTSVSFFGLVGTLLAIRVLVKARLNNSFSTLLVGLAACDSVFLACAVLIIGLPKACTWQVEQTLLFPRFLPSFDAFLPTTGTAPTSPST